MVGLLKYCRNSKILSDIKQILRYSHNIPRNGGVTVYEQPIFKRQFFSDTLKVKHFSRGSAVAVRLSSNFSNERKKVFELIFRRRGVVLVGVLLSIVTGYYIILLSICIVLDEVIKKTVR